MQAKSQRRIAYDTVRHKVNDREGQWKGCMRKETRRLICSLDLPNHRHVDSVAIL